MNWAIADFQKECGLPVLAPVKKLTGAGTVIDEQKAFIPDYVGCTGSC